MSSSDENGDVVDDITTHGDDSTDPAGDQARRPDDEQQAADPTGQADTASDAPKD